MMQEAAVGLGQHRRRPAIDIFRGLAISCMLLVNELPDEAGAYPLLLHSRWEGITFADLAFPGFVFSMGLAGALWFPKHSGDSAWTKAGIIVRRGMLLFLLGCVLNQVPMILRHMLYPEAGGSLWADLVDHGRIPGVLQRLGLVYVCGMAAVWRLRRDLWIGAFALLLLAVSSSGFHLYHPAAPFSPEGNISMALDSIFPGRAHCYLQGDFDPEGLYGTIAATSSFLLGFLAGRCLTQGSRDDLSSIRFLLPGGISLMLLGYLWSMEDLVCKALWTAPYALLTGGGFMLLLALLQTLLCLQPALAKVIFAPCRIMGTNALLLYLLSEMTILLLWTLETSSGQPVFVFLWEISLKGLVDIPFSIFLYAFLWLNVWLSVAIFFHKKHIYLKI